MTVEGIEKKPVEETEARGGEAESMAAPRANASESLQKRRDPRYTPNTAVGGGWGTGGF